MDVQDRSCHFYPLPQDSGPEKEVKSNEHKNLRVHVTPGPTALKGKYLYYGRLEHQAWQVCWSH